MLPGKPWTERFKLSGVGREWGRFGIEELLEYKSVIG
jgi:aldehyde dehydrogenase (NAD+)